MALSFTKNIILKLSPAPAHYARFHKLNSSALFSFLLQRNFSSAAYKYETLAVTSPYKHVVHVELNRPEKLNAINKDLWREFLECFKEIHKDKDCRSVVISGSGRIFTSGLDFMDMGELSSVVTRDEDVARKAVDLQDLIATTQESFTAVEKCSKPVIAAVHGACVGAGLDLICSADIRYCTEDAWFQAKEVDIGMSADVGTLQRFPKIVGNDSLVREVVYTGRKITSADAVKMGLLSGVYGTKEALMKAAFDLAQLIASKSPVAVQGSKINMVYSRDHNVPESLKFQTYWNMTMLQSEDLMKAAMAAMNKDSKPPEFSNL